MNADSNFNFVISKLEAWLTGVRHDARRQCDRILGPIVDDIPFVSGDKVLLLVNGMGGTPQVELYIVFRRAAEVLASKGIEVTRTLVGNYTTSLEMQGASITVLKLDDELTALWDAPVHTAALRWGR